MKGIPQNLQTRDDWLHAFAYVRDTGDGKVEFTERLRALQGTKTRLVLKESAKKKKAEDQTTADFESEEDPSSAFALSGLSDADIDTMLTKLGV